MQRFTSTISKCYRAIFRHYSLHTPERIGQFAGSLLPLGGWRHDWLWDSRLEQRRAAGL